MRFWVLCLLLVGCFKHPDSEDDSGSGGNGNGTAPPQNAAHYACDKQLVDSTCDDFPDGTKKDFVNAHCADGKIVAAACPSEDSVGSCAYKGDSGNLTTTYYGGGVTPHTADDAKSACDGFTGKFSSP